MVAVSSEKGWSFEVFKGFVWGLALLSASLSRSLKKIITFPRMFLNLWKHSTLIIFRSIEPWPIEKRFWRCIQQRKRLFLNQISLALPLEMGFKFRRYVFIVFRRNTLELFFVFSLLLLTIGQKKWFYLIRKRIFRWDIEGIFFVHHKRGQG